MRSTSGTTKQTKTSANKNIVRQTNTYQRRLSRGAVRSGGRYALERLEYALQEKKHTGRQPRSTIQPIKPRKTAEQTILISKHAEKHFASTACVGTKAHCATKYKHTPRIEPKSKKPVLIRISQENSPKARKKTQKKYCVSRETLNIISIIFSQTHRVSYCEKQKLQKKNSK